MLRCLAVAAVGLVGWLFAQWNHPRPTEHTPYTEQERMRW